MSYAHVAMLERIYLDNVRSFVNFEWRPGKLSLLLGRNGAGKTALFDVIADLRRFVGGEESVGECFPASSRTRWDTRHEQRLELDVRLAGRLYRYDLLVRHDPKGTEEPSALEQLSCDGRSIVELRADGVLRVHLEDGSQIEVPGRKATRSGVGMMSASADPALERFLRWMRDVWLLRPDPRAMTERIDRRRATKPPWLANDMSNFAAWYPPMLTTKPASMFKAMQALQHALPGLVELYEDDGALSARFELGQTTSSYAFDELSDGERALVALYVVMYGVAGPGKTLLLDEPDNYVALREVQPWLAELADRALRSDGPQVMLISHHPDTLNFFAVDNGHRVFRDDGGPTRVERFQPAENTGAAETVARGWDEPG